MPDFTTELRQQCSSRSASTTVPSSKGDTDYRVFVTLGETPSSCECKGFEFRGRCKHVDAEKAKLCGWGPGDDKYQSPQEEMEMKCPRCGGDTEFVSVAV